MATLTLALLTTDHPARAQDDTETQKPAKPGSLRIKTTKGALNVSLDWQDVSGADEYLVRWPTKNGDLNKGVSTPSSATNITVADYGRWVVRVQACNYPGCGLPRAQGFDVVPDPTPTPTPTPEPPDRPGGLVVSTRTGSLEVSADWNDVDDATSFVVHWRHASPQARKYWRATVQSSQAATKVLHTSQWMVKVEACNANGCGPGAVQTFRLKQPPVPAKPTGLRISTQPGPMMASLNWQDVAGATRYEVKWRQVTDIRSTRRTSVRASDAAITVARHGQWLVQVQACNKAGCGPGELGVLRTKPAPA